MATLTHLILAVAALLGSLAALVSAVRNAGKIQSLHADLNSRLTQLVESVRSAAHAQGVTEGEANERGRRKGQ
jgi:hypothetical protein